MNEWGAGGASWIDHLTAWADQWGWLAGVAAATAVAWGVRALLNSFRRSLAD